LAPLIANAPRARTFRQCRTAADSLLLACARDVLAVLARRGYRRREPAVHLPIRVTLAVVMAQRNVKPKDLAEHVGITESNLSLLKQGRVKGVRFETLEKICDYLDCEPGDILAREKKG
jgi:putative transcriptional regulator